MTLPQVLDAGDCITIDRDLALQATSFLGINEFSASTGTSGSIGPGRVWSRGQHARGAQDREPHRAEISTCWKSAGPDSCDPLLCRSPTQTLQAFTF